MTALKISAAIAVLCIPISASALTLFETSTRGPMDAAGGLSAYSGQYLGVRFEVLAPVVVTEFGGHMGDFLGGGSGLFAAFNKLAGPTDYPDCPNLCAFPALLAVINFVVPQRTQDVVVDHQIYEPGGPAISIPLDPGWYSVTFGSGNYGATSTAVGFPQNGEQIGNPLFFIGSERGDWREFPNMNIRAFVRGLAVPEPGVDFPLGLALLIVGTLRTTAPSARRLLR